MPWFTQLLIGIALNVIAYLLTPKPPSAKPEPLDQFEDPVAEAGKPIGVVFGSVRVSELNIIGFWDKQTIKREVSAGGKK